MNLNQLAATLRMLGWTPLGSGIMQPPEQYPLHHTIMLVSENEILLGHSQSYLTNDETFNIIMENTKAAKEQTEKNS